MPDMDEVYTVSRLTQELRGYLERSYPAVWVEGEISGLARPASGHVYFALKDERALLQCVCWRSTVGKLDAALEDGTHIVARGKLSIYPPRGQHQLIVDTAHAAGMGLLQQRFEELKRRLEAEGLFASERKRPLPALPRRIGVVTSPDGAAVRDFLRVLERRFPYTHVVIAPAQVQGKQAAGEIARGIALLNACDLDGRSLDVIVVTRGGGSLEDLWPFNEEVVARAIAASRLPVVSAVGHEVDFTIADFVADFRAATPTAAAEQLIGSLDDLQAGIAQHARRVRARMRDGLARQRRRLGEARRVLRLAGPRARVESLRQTVDHASLLLERAARSQLAARRAALQGLRARLMRARPAARMIHYRLALNGQRARMERALRNAVSATHDETRRRRADLHHALQRALRKLRQQLQPWGPRAKTALKHRVALARSRLAAVQTRLQALDYRAVLRRGFSVATTADGRVVRRVEDVALGQSIEVGVVDGSVSAVVTHLQPRARKKEEA